MIEIHEVFRELDKNYPISYTRLSEIVRRQESVVSDALRSSQNHNRDYLNGQLEAIKRIRLSFHEAFRLNPYQGGDDFFNSTSITNRSNSPYFHLEGKSRVSTDPRIGAVHIGIHWADFLSAHSAIISETMSLLSPKDFFQTAHEILMKKLIEESPFFRGMVIVLDHILRELGYQVSFLPGPREGTILISPGGEMPIQRITAGEWNLLSSESTNLLSPGGERK